MSASCRRGGRIRDFGFHDHARKFATSTSSTSRAKEEGPATPNQRFVLLKIKGQRCTGRRQPRKGHRPRLDSVRSDFGGQGRTEQLPRASAYQQRIHRSCSICCYIDKQPANNKPNLMLMTLFPRNDESRSELAFVPAYQEFQFRLRRPAPALVEEQHTVNKEENAVHGPCRHRESCTKFSRMD